MCLVCLKTCLFWQAHAPTGNSYLCCSVQTAFLHVSPIPHRTCCLPVLYVFGREELDVEDCALHFRRLFPDSSQHLIVQYDTAYFYAMGMSTTGNSVLIAISVPLNATLVFTRLCVKCWRGSNVFPRIGITVTKRFRLTLPWLQLEGQLLIFPQGYGLGIFVFYFVSAVHVPSLNNWMRALSKQGVVTVCAEVWLRGGSFLRKCGNL